MKVRYFLIVSLMLLLVFAGRAENIILTNGETIEGKIVSINDEKVKIEIAGNLISIPRHRIANGDELLKKQDNTAEPAKIKTSSLPIISVTPVNEAGEEWPENPSLTYWPVQKKKEDLTSRVTQKETKSSQPADRLPNLFSNQLGERDAATRPPSETTAIFKPEEKGQGRAEVAGLPGLFTIALNKTSGAAVASEKPASPVPAVKAELRGVWVTRFEWPSRDPAIMKKTLVEVMDTLASANFNAVFLQVRGQGDVLYRSSYEPWSPLIDSKDPGFDPLEFAVQEAHKRGLELHAYVNPIPIWQGKEMPPRTNPPHPFSIYGKSGSAQNWLCCDAKGQPMGFSPRADRYFYLSPGIPEVQDYVRKIIIDIVKRYDVDGIHLDRIRYPGRQFSHDPVSKKRFLAEGNPNQLDWADWQREQLNRLVYNLYAEIMAVKPKVKLTSAVWGIYNKYRIPGYQRFSSGYHDYYQDSWAWVKEGAMDAIVPMIYWDIGGQQPDYDKLLADFANNLPERHIYGGMGGGHVSNIEELKAEIEITRTHNGKGNVIFSWGRVKKNDYWKEIKEQVYKETLPVPDMPWKSQPTQGVIIGYVYDRQGKPVVDALLNLSGRDENWLSTANGFFGILKVDPRYNHQLKISKKGFELITFGPLKIKPGEVTQLKLTLKPSGS